MEASGRQSANLRTIGSYYPRGSDTQDRKDDVPGSEKREKRFSYSACCVLYVSTVG